MISVSSLIVCNNFLSPPEIKTNKQKAKFSSLLVCKNSIKTTNKVLVRRFSGDPYSDWNPYFTTLSTTTSDNDNCCSPIIKHNDYISLPFPKTHHHYDYYHIKVVGSCDGLVCLAVDKGYKDLGGYEGAVIWNPSTNDYKMLPDSDTDSSIQKPPSAECSIFTVCGFGFDPKSQDYKMLRFVKFTFDCMAEHAEVYSLKNDSWREVNPPNFTGLCNCNMNFTPTTIDGRCYLLAQFHYVPVHVLCFDFSTEEFLPPIPLPDAITETMESLEILEFDGSVAVLNVSIGGEYNVWVLDHSTSTWSHVSVIRHSSTLTRPIGFMGKDKLFFEGGHSHDEDADRQLLVYDCVAREMESLGIYEDHKYVLDIVPYNSDDQSYSAPPLNGKSSAAAVY